MKMVRYGVGEKERAKEREKMQVTVARQGTNYRTVRYLRMTFR